MLGDTVTARQALQKAGQDGTADLKSLDTLDKLKEDAAAAYNSKDFRKVGLFVLLPTLKTTIDIRARFWHSR